MKTSPQTKLKKITKYLKEIDEEVDFTNPIVFEIFRIIDDKQFLFKELNSKAKLKAAKDYRNEYNDRDSNEDHNDDISLEDAISCCHDCDDNDFDDRIYYNKKGEQV